MTDMELRNSLLLKNLNKYRYERKFSISSITKPEIESNVNLNPLLFSEIYHERYINNIYLDTNNLSFYNENIVGLANRIKVRIRWYGDLFGLIRKPVLELKIKDGLLGRKLTFPIRSFKLDNAFNSDLINKIFLESDIPIELKMKLKLLDICLLNRYSRKYFISQNKIFRITIDSDQAFIQINNQNNSFSNRHYNDTDTILELKYDDSYDGDASYITNYFPFRMTKNSKYVSGMQYIYHIFY